jgi:acyl-CoA dehydrogenase
MRGGAVVTDLLDEFDARARRLAEFESLTDFGARLAMAVEAAREATLHLGAIAGTDPRSLLGASVPYLRLLGTTVCAGLLAKAAIAASSIDDEFARSKVVSARFFGEQILPTVHGLLPAVLAPSDDLYALSPSQLAST